MDLNSETSDGSRRTKSDLGSEYSDSNRSMSRSTTVDEIETVVSDNCPVTLVDQRDDSDHDNHT